MTDAVVFCEGYYDRAFLAGWLEQRGFIPCRPLKGSLLSPVKSVDPDNKSVSGSGQYGYWDSSGLRFVRVKPVDGDTHIVADLEAWLTSKLSIGTPKTTYVAVVCVDADVNFDGSPTGSKPVTDAALEAAIKRVASEASCGLRQWNVLPDMRVELIRWETSDALADGIPNKQTLERLVCAALAAAYPERAAAVENWLSNRPDKPAPDPKEHAWSYMAGWWAGHGSEDFLRHVWRDEKVAAELEDRLRTSGAWDIVAKL